MTGHETKVLLAHLELDLALIIPLAKVFATTECLKCFIGLKPGRTRVNLKFKANFLTAYFVCVLVLCTQVNMVFVMLL